MPNLTPAMLYKGHEVQDTSQQDEEYYCKADVVQPEVSADPALKW